MFERTPVLNLILIWVFMVNTKGLRRFLVALALNNWNLQLEFGLTGVSMQIDILDDYICILANFYGHIILCSFFMSLKYLFFHFEGVGEPKSNQVYHLFLLLGFLGCITCYTGNVLLYQCK